MKDKINIKIKDEYIVAGEKELVFPSGQRGGT